MRERDKSRAAGDRVCVCVCVCVREREKDSHLVEELRH